MSMWWDLSLQGLMFAISIGTFLWANDYPRKLLAWYRSYRNRHKHLSRQHFVKAATFLSQSRSYPRSSPQSLSLAASCAAEADSAVKLDPTDAANHIILALALDLQGFKPSALDSINAALSPLASASLSDEEKADALLKRAELRVEVSQGADVQIDLKEAIKLNNKSVKAWCLLGECCEGLDKLEEAREAFQEALQLDPASLSANQGLKRLVSSS